MRSECVLRSADAANIACLSRNDDTLDPVDGLSPVEHRPAELQGHVLHRGERRTLSREPRGYAVREPVRGGDAVPVTRSPGAAARSAKGRRGFRPQGPHPATWAGSEVAIAEAGRSP